MPPWRVTSRNFCPRSGRCPATPVNRHTQDMVRRGLNSNRVSWSMPAIAHSRQLAVAAIIMAPIFAIHAGRTQLSCSPVDEYQNRFCMYLLHPQVIGNGYLACAAWKSCEANRELALHRPRNAIPVALALPVAITHSTQRFPRSGTRLKQGAESDDRSARWE